MATLTVESAKSELQALRNKLFAEIGKLMEVGLSHTDALIEAYKNNPGWNEREHQLTDFLKMARRSANSLSEAPGEDTMKVTASEKRKEMLDRLDAEMDRMATARMSGTKLQYHEALKLVARENPDLDFKRTALRRSIRSRGEDE